MQKLNVKPKIFKKITPAILAILFCILSFILRSPTAHATASWYSPSWLYRTQITINHNQVASSTGSLNTNFPVLISTTTTALKYTGAPGGGGHVASSTGGDVIFTDSNGTSPLNYEIESYASSTGALVAWAKIPSLATSTDTSIYMYYGNVAATVPAASVATGVWDDGGNNYFKGVWHLPNGTTLMANDSTSNGNNGTVNTASVTAGVVDGAASFGGSGNGITISSTSSLNITSAITLGMWAKSTNKAIGQVFSKNTSISAATPYEFQFWNDGNMYVNLKTSAGFSGNVYYPYTTGQWYHVVETYDGSRVKMYVNGDLQRNIAWSGLIDTNSSALYLGSSGGAGPFNGSLDEARLSNIARSADWIKTEYNNQNSPSIFETSASEETYSAPSGSGSGMMSSSHYTILSDSLNFGGGYSTSTNYIQESTGGEVATGFSSSTNYIMSAGYQQMNIVALSLVPPSSVVMSPNIGGVTGGTGNGSTNFTVTTDDPAGYTSTIQASSSPALVDTASSTNSFADYSPAGSAPDFTFGIAATASAFAFSSQGTDADQRFLNNTSICNIGSNSTAQTCWDGLSTSPKNVADRTSANSPSGIQTTLYFRAASGTNHIQVNGVYVATTTLTVLPL